MGGTSLRKDEVENVWNKFSRLCQDAYRDVGVRVKQGCQSRTQSRESRLEQRPRSEHKVESLNLNKAAF